MDPTANDDTVGDLEQLIQLLDRAGRELHRAGALPSHRSPLNWLPLGVLLARARAVDLLPEGHKVDDLICVEDLLDQALDQTHGVGTAGERSAQQLLRAAEQLTRSDALLDADLPGFAALVVELCDLIREADRGGR